MKKHFLILTFSLAGYSLNAQIHPLKGSVRSVADSTVLIGATVQVNNNVTKTDQNGNFTINADKIKGFIHVTFTGYQNKDIEYDASSALSYEVYIDPKENALDEAVVIAYGTTTKRFNTGSVGRVTAAEISRQPVANPIAALQGRIPGVEITQQSGRTGANFSVLIRGQSSIANGNEPLFIVDGVPWLSGSISQQNTGITSQSPFNSINPSDIESIEVLKDADATAIYGSRGANGIILITTKKGVTGKTEVNLNAYTGISKVGHTMPLMNTQRYLAMRSEALTNDGITPTNTNAPDLLLYDQNRYTDWKDMLIGNTAKLTDIQTSLSGGNNNTQFRLAGAYRRETNVYPGDEANKRGSGQFNLNHYLNERFQTSLTVNYSNDNNNILPGDLTGYVYTAPNLKIYEKEGSLAWSENGSAIFSNPLANTLLFQSTTTNSLISNLNLSYEINSGLKFRINGGYNNTQMHETNVTPLAAMVPSQTNVSGSSRFGESSFRSWIVEPQLNFDKSFDEHKLNILIGASWQEELLKGIRINASDYSSESLLFTPSGAATITSEANYSLYRYQSVFGRINYQYRNRYLVNLTGRRDGSSRFGPGRQFANFGALGLAWIFSEEATVKTNIPFLSFGKIRGSYGLTGNDKIGNYQFMDTYGSVSRPYDDVIGLAPERLFNSDYKWESNRKLEFALDIGLFSDKVLISSSWFRNRSDNQLLQYKLPTQTGFSSITRNLPALVENKGLEFEINTTNYQSKKFTWNTAFNITLARNKLLEFANLETSSYASRYTIGESLNIVKMYPYLGVNSETGLWTVDVEAGRTVIKDLTAKFYGGFSNTFQYKGFQLDAFFQFVKKDAWNFIYTLPGSAGYLNYNAPLAMESRWDFPGSNGDIQRFSSASGEADEARSNYFLSDGVITDASFIRLKSLSLSYILPAQWTEKVKLQKVKFYFHGQNLFTITDYQGNDPEITSMITLPPLRTITFGTQITF